MSEHAEHSGWGIPIGQQLQCTVPELAARLGIDVQVIRDQIDRGELLGIKTDDEWTVYVDLPDEPFAGITPSASAGVDRETDESLDEVPSAPTVQSAAVPTPDSTDVPMPVAIPISPVDLTLLINLVRDLTQRNAELLESTAKWRAKVQALEEQQLQHRSARTQNWDGLNGRVRATSANRGLLPPQSRGTVDKNHSVAGPDQPDRAHEERELIEKLFRGPVNGSEPEWMRSATSPGNGPWWRRWLRRV